MESYWNFYSVENLIEYRPEQVCKDIAQESGLLTWLVKKLKVKVPFDNNKLYASGVTSISFFSLTLVLHIRPHKIQPPRRDRRLLKSPSWPLWKRDFNTGIKLVQDPRIFEAPLYLVEASLFTFIIFSIFEVRRIQCAPKLGLFLKIVNMIFKISIPNPPYTNNKIDSF